MPAEPPEYRPDEEPDAEVWAYCLSVWQAGAPDEVTG